jgi:hypothetical protein
MSNKQQTAVEWFAQESWKLRVELEGGKISLGEYANKYYQLKEQAKEMEKEQIINAVDGFPLANRNLDGSEYYEKTYGGDK